MANKNINPTKKLLTMLSMMVLIYTGIDFMLRSAQELTVFIVAFALLWASVEVALFVYRNFVQPSAKSIIKNYK